MQYYQLYNVCKAIARASAAEQIPRDRCTFSLRRDEYVKLRESIQAALMSSIPPELKQFVFFGVTINVTDA